MVDEVVDETAVGKVMGVVVGVLALSIGRCIPFSCAMGILRRRFFLRMGLLPPITFGVIFVVMEDAVAAADDVNGESPPLVVKLEEGCQHLGLGLFL